MDRLEAELAAPGTPPTAAELAIAELSRRRNQQHTTAADQYPARDDAPVPVPVEEGLAAPESLRLRLAKLQEALLHQDRKAQRRDTPGSGPESEGPHLG